MPSIKTSYRNRLIQLDLLPLAYDREIKDLLFFFKSINGCTFINLNEHISFVKHGRTRLSSSSIDLLRVPLCSTATFQDLYFNRIVKLWNLIATDTPPTNFYQPVIFKAFSTEQVQKTPYLNLWCRLYPLLDTISGLFLPFLWAFRSFRCYTICNFVLVYSILHVYLFHCFIKFAFSVGLRLAWDSVSRSCSVPIGYLSILCKLWLCFCPIKLLKIYTASCSGAGEGVTLSISVT